LPWIGKFYRRGFKGHRLLIVGHSHYFRKRREAAPGVTRKVVSWAIDRELQSNFLTLIERTLLGIDDPARSKAFWHSVAFYNFLQSDRLRRPRQAVRREEWLASRSPFHAVLGELRPERILVFSKTTWDWTGHADLWLHNEVQAFRLGDGTTAWCLALPHTKWRGYSPKKWHPLVAAFLRDHKNAARLLTRAHRRDG